MRQNDDIPPSAFFDLTDVGDIPRYGRRRKERIDFAFGRAAEREG